MTDKDPDRKPLKRGRKVLPMTKEQWKLFIHKIANGESRRDAQRMAKITHGTLQGYLLAEPEAPVQLRAATQAWIRRDWPHDRIEEFLGLVSSGMTNTDSAKEMDFMDKELSQLMRIIMTDRGIKEEYDIARQLQAEAWSDEIIDISNDGSKDTYEVTSKTGTVYLKTDHEVINRSRLRIDARKWIMARLHHERFGDRIDQNIKGELNVNHADVLDSARKRKEKAKQDQANPAVSKPIPTDSDSVTVH